MSGVWKPSGSDIKAGILVVVLLAVIAIVGRLVPHPPNFAPVAAVAVFGGALLPRKLAVVLPLTVMIVSDLIIGLHSTIFWTWGAFVVIALLSRKTLAGRIGALNTVRTSLWASVFFYLVTNFGVWLQGYLYPLTAQGLLQCYINALPFFRNTLTGDLFYVGVLFGGYWLAVKAVSLKRTPARLPR